MCPSMSSVPLERCDLVPLSPEECIRHLVESDIDHAMMMIDPSGIIRYANGAAHRTFGYAPDELVGLPLSRMYIPEDRALGIDLQEFATAAREERAIDERWHQRKDGSRFWASGTLRAIRSPNGKVIAFAKICLDRTSRKRTDDELRASNAALASFAHRAAHDLQEPLRSIAAGAGILRRRCGRCAGDRFLHLIQDSARRMSSLIQGILRHAELEKRNESLQDAVELALVFDASVANLREAIRASQAEVLRGPLPLVQGAPFQLLSLLQNLIGNAIKYRGPDRPRIFVSAMEHDNHFVQIAVQDNGVGVPEADLERIFQPFERGTSEGSAVQGTGLGLAYGAGVVAEHGGRIWMESKVGVGSIVRFTLRKG